MDEANEEIYQTETFAEDLYHNIDNLMPEPEFQKILFKTKNITDKVDGNGFSLLKNYPGTLNTKCSEYSIFNHSLHQMAERWDGEKSIILNDFEKWQQLNKLTPYTLICNRFRGLSCQFKRASDPEFDNGKSFEPSDNPTCQCAGDSGKIGFYKQVSGSSSSYPDGCYVRPWKQCQHLSLDQFFKNNYIQWHTNTENWRRQLAQIVFPVARTHRCKQGTYCVDIVPGMIRPICYCSTNSNDEGCRKTAKLPSARVPLGNELASIRRAFVKLILPSNDTISLCNSEYNEDVVNISKSVGLNPTVTKVLDLMKKLAFTKTKIQICDFREGILCDAKTSTCKGNLNCDIGTVHLGKGVCAVNNGFPCQGNEDCVENARCQIIPGSASSQRICVCERGYGHLCELEKAPFFTKLFLPIVSGFQGDKFIKIQTEVNKRVEAWEDSMTLGEGEGCKPVADSASVAIVKYFGNLELYDEKKGDILLNKVSDALQEGIKLCSYFKFLRCDEFAYKCVPMTGSRVLPTSTHSNINPNGVIVVELQPETPCQLDAVKIFKDIVVFVCPRGYICKKSKELGLKVCAPDCNSISAPLKACPVVPPSTVNMTEELGNDIETTTESITTPTTLSPEETTLPPQTPQAPLPAIAMQKDKGKNDFDYVKATKEEDYIDEVAAEEAGAKSKAKAFEEIEAQYDSGSRLFLNDSNTNREADHFLDKDNPIQTKQNDVDNTQEKLAKPGRPDQNQIKTDLETESTVPPPSLRIKVQVDSNLFDSLTDPKPETTETVSNLNTKVAFQTDPPEAETTTTVSKTESVSGIKSETQPPPAIITATPISTYLDVYSARSSALAEDNNTRNNTLADEEDVDTTVNPIPPGPKGKIGRLCAYNDTRAEYPDTNQHLICDGKLFLVCVDNQCQCLEGLVYYPFLHTCTIPIAERCGPDIWKGRLPWYMDFTNLKCEYGAVCKRDNVHKVCRPESDSGLLLRNG